ncbi:MAG: hypothetical protein N5P05_003399 [Chroococcopsis gigantea SAG 12.99]|jgi:hypothetical protein|nr:hypothetical protein [Chlorogloea purpurea SAG 13.99]MDV3001793.1 hypothetical protein [Chroococcopsis gigantea SAG 12.99]
MKNAIVISYWSSSPPSNLINLLGQIRSIKAGAAFDILLVCNGDSSNIKSVLIQEGFSSTPLLERPNTGYNIGAWDAGWRELTDHDNFLFLQDDCLILRKNWLKGYLDKFCSNSSIGLLGESLNWSVTWESLEKSNYNNFHRDHTLDGVKMRRIDLYRAFLKKNAIPEGSRADHLQSLILFTERPILNKIGGFCAGNSYGEAIASEIAISKKVQAAGYITEPVKPQNCFYYISHPQWEKRKRKLDRIILKLESWLDFSI